MANTNKTKAEILQELESIKGLLLEEDDIPILQDAEILEEIEIGEETEITEDAELAIAPFVSRNESVLPGQGSLFEEISTRPVTEHLQTSLIPKVTATTEAKSKRNSFSSSISSANPTQNPRQIKAVGENPFLPQHIRERLHGNNPPPLFEYETLKKPNLMRRNFSSALLKPRKQLIDEVITSLMPQIENELRHRLFAMSVDDLEKIMNDND